MTSHDATPKPEIRTLNREQIDALLARNQVGRVAYSYHDRVGIEPVHYAYAHGWIYFRTSPGSKLTTFKHQPWVAFEVDEVRDVFEWSSVVVNGTVYITEVDGPEHEREQHAQGVAALRQIVPAAFTDADPTPFRSTLLRVRVDEVTGKASRVAP